MDLDASQVFNYDEANHVRYQVLGTGNVVLLMLPGALGTKETDFSAQFEALDQNIYTLVSWDPPGYGCGTTERHWEVDMLDKDVEVVVRLMKHLNFPRFSILGYSDGANTAFLIAAKYPGMVDKVIAVGGNAFLDEEDLRIYDESRDVSTWEPEARDAMVSVYGQDRFAQLWNRWCDTMARIYHERNGDICKEALRQIKARALIVHGRKDGTVPLHHALYLAEHVIGSDLWIIADAGHDPHLTHAKLFNSVMTSFLTTR